MNPGKSPTEIQPGVPRRTWNRFLSLRPVERFRHGLIGILFLFIALSTFPLSAGTLRVGVSENRPFAYKDRRGELRGFSVDLLKSLSSELGLKLKFESMDFSRKIRSLENGKIDLAVGGISVTHERARKGILFTYPTMNAGLTILVKKSPTELSVIPLIISNLFTLEVGRMLAFLFGVLLFWGFWLWLAERGSDVIRDQFPEGFHDAVWCAWAIKTTIGFGDVYPKRILGRTLTIPIFFTGAVVIAIVAAPINAAFVQRNLGATVSLIHSVSDLRGKSVATKSGTLAARIMETYGARVREEKTLEKAFALLKKEAVDAVVFDAPNLIRYAKNHPEFVTTGPLFRKHHFAIALAPGREKLRERMNRILLKFREDGRYDRIYNRYF